MGNAGSERMAESSMSNLSAAWNKRADWLAHWAKARLVNRTDQWIRYLPLQKRELGLDGQIKIWRAAPKSTKPRKPRLSEKTLAKHFSGKAVGDLLGIYSLSSDNLTKWAAVSMKGSDVSPMYEANLSAVLHWYDALKALGFRPLLIDRD